MIADETRLEELLSEPTDAVATALGGVVGDLVVLGAGGKMGPTLARMARRAMPDARVVAVSRFNDTAARERLEQHGVRTITCDLLDSRAVRDLPDAGAIVFLAGQKFGTRGAASTTWAANAAVPAIVAERYAGVPSVVLSSGNVYPFVPVDGPGANETTAPAPVGEYAWSVLARERIFEHASRTAGTFVTIARLNYATELRYGVLVDVAQQVFARRPIDISMGYANVVWQGDANAYVLRLLETTASPPSIYNLTGAERVSIRDLATRFGELFGIEPEFTAVEGPTALLADASRLVERFGRPTVALDALIEWTAAWIRDGGRTLGKPTQFETRDGAF